MHIALQINSIEAEVEGKVIEHTLEGNHPSLI
jgi:hypothetical protein